MKAVMLSIQPKYCELIANGKKTIEVRKTKPNIDTPFKGYIYCTKIKDNKRYTDEFDIPLKTRMWLGNGKVIGEFVCDKILHIPSYVGSYEDCQDYEISDEDLEKICLGQGDLFNYNRGKPLYGWHISDLVIYDKPKELSEFFMQGECTEEECKEREHCKYLHIGEGWLDGSCCDESYCKLERGIKPLKRPPQSWCYAEELK